MIGSIEHSIEHLAVCHYALHLKCYYFTYSAVTPTQGTVDEFYDYRTAAMHHLVRLPILWNTICLLLCVRLCTCVWASECLLACPYVCVTAEQHLLACFQVALLLLPTNVDLNSVSGLCFMVENVHVFQVCYIVGMKVWRD